MPSSPPESTGRLSEPAVGFLYTLAAFLLWGVSPVFWKWIDHVPATELVAHRIFWCCLLMALLTTARGGWGRLRDALRNPRTVGVLVATTTLIGSNWWLYILAVFTDRILQASLGYFINPLVSVLLGMLFLGERLRPAQWASVVLATVGVVILSLRVGVVPWLSLALALTFGFYGLLRKRVAASPSEGLLVETGILAPFVFIYLVVLGRRGEGHWGFDLAGGDLRIDLLLFGTGVITALPLLWFTHGAKRLPLSTVGLLQYIAPTMQFLLAVLVYKETFTTSHLISFVFIWVALAIFSVDSWRALRRPAG